MENGSEVVTQVDDNYSKGVDGMLVRRTGLAQYDKVATRKRKH